MDHHLLQSFFIFGDLPVNARIGTYTHFLFALSYIVAALGCYTGLSVANLIHTSKYKRIMRALSAFAYGTGFWAMHFIGIIAYKSQIQVSYNLWITFLSLGFAVIVLYFVLTLTRGSSAPSWPRLVLAALLTGIGICGTHYAGLMAMEMNAALRFIPSLFLLSFALVLTTTVVAFWIIFKLTLFRNYPLVRNIFASLLLGAGICGAFLVSMKATIIIPFSAATLTAATQSPQILAVAVLTATTLLFFILTFSISNRIFLTAGFGALFALPLIVIINQAVSGLNLEIQGIQKAQSGLVYHGALLRLLDSAEDLRDIASVSQTNPAAFSDRLSQTIEKVRETLQIVDGYDRRFLKKEAIFQRWSQIKSDLVGLLRFNEAEGLVGEYNSYSTVIRRLLDYSNDVADEANIAATFGQSKDFMLDFSVHMIPQLKESLSVLRNDAARMLAPNRKPEEWTDEEKLKLKYGFYSSELLYIDTKGKINRAETLNETSFDFLNYDSQTIAPLMRNLKAAIADIGATRAPMSDTEIYALVTDIMRLLEPFYDNPTKAAISQLEQQEGTLRFTINLIVCSSVAAFLGFISLFVFLNRSLLRVARAQTVAETAQQELALRLKEKERLERQMQEYTDRLELSRFDVMAINAKLKEEETKIRAIMDNVLEGIVTVDDAGIIQTFNKAAETVFGYSFEEVKGHTIGHLVPPERQPEIELPFQQYVRTQAPGFIGVEHEIIGQRKDGSRFPTIFTASEVVLGKTRLFIILLRDITAQKEKEEDLLRTKERAEDANKTKSEFLANMSHELRTPLNSVFGMTRLLLGTKLTVEQQELAQTVLLSSTNLKEIVDDILDLSKIEAHEVSLERIGFDPRGIFHTIVRSLAGAARDKHIPIVRLYENETLPFVLGDPLRFGRIVTNLLSNAIKYTNEGHIEVRASARPLDDTHIELRCEVTDTGIGIPAEKIESVFEKFVQADSSTTRKYGGTGLGLAITRELVFLMGGKIGVTSQIGSGSTFWFAIPFETTEKLHEELDTRQQKNLQGTVSLKNARILVAEDHPMNQMLIRRLLNKFGIGDFKIVANGKEAFASFKCEPWTAILMDCHMPEMNGYDSTAVIREEEKKTGLHVPIVAMTANAMVGDKEKCLLAGMDEYISKPIEIEELKEVLSQWIAFYDETIETTEEFMQDLKPAVDLTMLRTLTGGDEEVEKELMRTFVDQSDKNIKTLEETVSAEGEDKPWSEAAHMLKGGSGSIGAEELRQLCSEAQLYKGDSFGRQALLQRIAAEYGRVKEHLTREGLLS